MCATLLLASQALSASNDWKTDLALRINRAFTAGTALYHCPELTKTHQLVGKPCAAAQAKVIGTALVGVLSDAAGGATQGRCVAQLKAIRTVAESGATTALTFAVAQPSSAIANVNARTAVLTVMTNVLHRDAAFVLCMKRG